jgi:hypothetical protein
MPGPTQYEVGLNIILKKNLAIYKMDRKSFCEDIIKKAKETPGVGAYDCTKMKDKVKGIFKRYAINVLTKIS